MRAVVHTIWVIAVWASAALAQDDVQDDAQKERLILPSGLEAELLEVLQEGDLRRFRFVAPAFTRAMTLEAISVDLEHLCEKIALPALAEPATPDLRIIMSLADIPSEFGVPDPDVAQVFEAYRVQDGLCIWEVF